MNFTKNQTRFMKYVVSMSRRRRMSQSETLHILHMEKGFCELRRISGSNGKSHD